MCTLFWQSSIPKRLGSQIRMGLHSKKTISFLKKLQNYNLQNYLKLKNLIKYSREVFQSKIKSFN